MQEYKRYTVHDKSTGEFLAEGTVSECAKALNLTIKGFQSAVKRAETLGHGKYEIVDLNPERKRVKWADSKSVNKELFEQAQKWDEFIAWFREVLGVPPLNDQDNKTNVDRCVCCGEPVPEGRQVCPICEEK